MQHVSLSPEKAGGSGHDWWRQEPSKQPVETKSRTTGGTLETDLELAVARATLLEKLLLETQEQLQLQQAETDSLKHIVNSLYCELRVRRSTIPSTAGTPSAQRSHNWPELQRAVLGPAIDFLPVLSPSVPGDLDNLGHTHTF